MQIGDYHIYSYEDVHRFIHYNEHKDRYDKICKELNSMKPLELGHDEFVTKKDLVTYMKRKMLCFYNPKIVTEMFNLMGLDKKETIRRFFLIKKMGLKLLYFWKSKEFCDYYLWFEEKTREWINNLSILNEELIKKRNLMLPDVSSKRNDYIYIILSVIFKKKSLKFILLPGVQDPFQKHQSLARGNPWFIAALCDLPSREISAVPWFRGLFDERFPGFKQFWQFPTWVQPKHRLETRLKSF